jgi:hypothetical protein
VPEALVVYYQIMAHGETPDPQAFIDVYGPDAQVGFDNGMSMKLGQALDMERSFCPADQVNRQDPAKRIRYLAKILAAGGSLRPEDSQYLPKPE